MSHLLIWDKRYVDQHRQTQKRNAEKADEKLILDKTAFNNPGKIYRLSHFGLLNRTGLLKESQCAPPPPFCWGGLNLQLNFQKGGLKRNSTLRRGLLGKRG